MGVSIDDNRLLIVGAGPTGLTAALKARLAGWRPIIVDRAPDKTDESRAVGINRASLDILQDTGVVPALMRRGVPIEKIRFFYRDKPLAQLRITPPTPNDPVMIALPQSETERILLHRLDSLDVKPTWNTHISDVSQTATGVTATTRTGETFEADWLLGADGSRSAVREALGIEFEGRTYPETWSLVDASVDWPWPDTQACPRLQADGSVLFLVTMGEGRYRIFSNRSNALERAQAHFKIENITHEATFEISLKRVDRYGDKRIWIAGDAAHVHSPVGGMGMNLGMEDAADFIATLTGDASDAAFAAYTARRIKAAKRVLMISDRGYGFASTSNPVLRATRNTLIRAFAAAGPARSWLTRTVFRTRDQA